MGFTLVECDASDLDDMAIIFTKAMTADPFWTTMKGNLPYEDEVEYHRKNLRPRVTIGRELGACRTFKVIDEDGKTVAWSGVGIPMSLTEDQKASVQSAFDLPPCRNEKLHEFFHKNVVGELFEVGFDPTIHFERQTMMVLPTHHGLGLGTLLTSKINSVADAANGTIYGRARPGAAALFFKQGYEVLKRVDFDVADFGGKGKTAIFMMRREPGAEGDRGRKLELGVESRW